MKVDPTRRQHNEYAEDILLLLNRMQEEFDQIRSNLRSSKRREVPSEGSWPKVNGRARVHYSDCRIGLIEAARPDHRPIVVERAPPRSPLYHSSMHSFIQHLRRRTIQPLSAGRFKSSSELHKSSPRTDGS